ncbi:DUF4054 domain-containing protein [Methylobacterium sp. WL19]|uniref:DUF4054 domain-containing protein n=1 Tax=Methylobacterium sp. WL19 TaxID=2603896 RepID=UPI0011C8E325|nr:DUF4054 domain-containing protein [Methylobacterium sp. WL19]TXN33904.1 DUF4054 domain-containing protein [Methylobacterium sp. WL19]
MTVTRDSFTAVFKEFSDITAYPDAAVTFWIGQAEASLPQSIATAQLDLATMLYVAHNLTLSTLGAAGGGAGAFAPTTSKSIDKVSKSMDPSLVMTAGAGIWNATAYGQRLYALLRSFGTGGFYRPSRRAAAITAAQGYPYR